MGLNFALDQPIADDETGFRGTGDLPYRSEAWDFLIAGGSAFSNLDYSFTTEHEDGTAEVSDPTPAGAARRFASRSAILKRFLEGFDFPRMTPDDKVIQGGVPTDATARAPVEEGKQYAIYVRGGTRAELKIAAPVRALPGRVGQPAYRSDR